MSLEWLYILPSAALALHYLWVDYSLWQALVPRKRSTLYPQTQLPPISILVCARNEEASLPHCLEHLLAQDYPPELTEILVADDRSTDGTAALLQEWQARVPGRIRVVTIEHLAPGTSPKKQALSRLAALAQGELFLLTDADCEVPASWARALVETYTPEILMVAGHSYMELPAHPSAFLGVQALEFHSHHVVSAASIALGAPITVSGNSLSYRRSFFESEGGFAGVEHIVSGDDDLLLHKLARKNPRAIAYCTRLGSAVRTWPQPTLRRLWEQRKRWASKTVYYTPRTVLLLLLVFLFYMTIPSLLVAGILHKSPPLLLTAGGAFLFKTLADYLVMRRGCDLFDSRVLLRWFAPTALAHIPLIVGAVIFGIFGKFRWKG